MSSSFKTFKKMTLQNSDVQREYDIQKHEFEIIKTIIQERTKRGWTQQQLADAIGSRQPVISRLERGDGNPSLLTLQKITAVFNKTLEIKMK